MTSDTELREFIETYDGCIIESVSIVKKTNRYLFKRVTTYPFCPFKLIKLLANTKLLKYSLPKSLK